MRTNRFRSAPSPVPDLGVGGISPCKHRGGTSREVLFTGSMHVDFYEYQGSAAVRRRKQNIGYGGTIDIIPAFARFRHRHPPLIPPSPRLCTPPPPCLLCHRHLTCVCHRPHAYAMVAVPASPSPSFCHRDPELSATVAPLYATITTIVLPSSRFRHRHRVYYAAPVALMSTSFTLRRPSPRLLCHRLLTYATVTALTMVPSPTASFS